MTTQRADSENVWHPYTQMFGYSGAIPIVRGEGAKLYSEGGKEFIDAIGSWWVNLHGHSHPVIAEAISDQAYKLEQVIFSDFTHQPATHFATELLKILPKNQKRIFFSDNGSTAVEVGLKMAIQYWQNIGRPRSKILYLENGYHGDTFGSMSVSGRGVFTVPFREYLFQVESIPTPLLGEEKSCYDRLREVVAGGDVAAIVFEPLIQGSGGMIMYQPEALDEILQICKEHEVITIADEVMTGFGRTGTYFALDHCEQSADILCFSKGITGGFLPMGATSCTQEIFDAFISEDKTKTFFHGHSFTGNPLACAAANASLKLLKSPECWANIKRIERRHQEFISELDGLNGAMNPRSRGIVFAVDVATSGETGYLSSIRNSLYQYFLSEGVLLRPLGNIVYLLPPYCITDDELNRCYEVIVKGIENFSD